MVWQDVVLSAAEIALVITIIPQLILGFKQKKGYITYVTAITATIALSAIGFAMFTLDLFLTSFVAFVNAVLWAVFIFQRMVWGGP